MQAAILTVGEELLAGDTENTNGTWLAGQLTDRGLAVPADGVGDDGLLVGYREHSRDRDATVGQLPGQPRPVGVLRVAGQQFLADREYRRLHVSPVGRLTVSSSPRGDGSV